MGTRSGSRIRTLSSQGWWRLRSLELPSTQLRSHVPKEKVVQRPQEVQGVAQEELGRRQGARGGACSSLALAIARREARDGLVVIPVSKKVL